MPLPLRFAPMLLLLALAACQRGPDTDGVEPAPAAAADVDATASAPAPAAPATDEAGTAPATTAHPAGTDYACADGTALQVRFGDHDATVRWADGRSVDLPRAESASKGGGDVYVGESVSLQRDDMRLQLHDGDRAATTCEPGAAARYACDGGVTLDRDDDGSLAAHVPGSQSVRLTRIAGSDPVVYTGASLYLRLGDGGAILSQGDQANELRCTAG